MEYCFIVTIVTAMEDKEKRIAALMNLYNKQLDDVQLPDIDVNDLLDLIDYACSMGWDFEAELYKRIAEKKFPDHPDVLLLLAHWEVDNGSWDVAHEMSSNGCLSEYESSLFTVEHFLRMMQPSLAYDNVCGLQAISDDWVYYDFLFDVAALFRDFGYMEYALKLLTDIPKTYPDFVRVLEIKAECCLYMTEYDEALTYLEQALDMNSFDDYLWNLQSLIYYKKHDYQSAVDASEYSLAIKQENPRAQHLYKLSKLQQKQCSAENLRQENGDYLALLEIGDILYGRGDYIGAESYYMKAGVFCERGSRDRLQIVFKTACTRVKQGLAADGVATFLSLLSQGVDLWPYAMDMLFLLYRQHQTDKISDLLLPLFIFDEPEKDRIEQIILFLYNCNCFTDVKSVWEVLFRYEKRISVECVAYLLKVRDLI